MGRQIPSLGHRIENGRILSYGDRPDRHGERRIEAQDTFGCRSRFLNATEADQSDRRKDMRHTEGRIGFDGARSRPERFIKTVRMKLGDGDRCAATS